MVNVQTADQLLRARVKLVDGKHLDPSERAELVNTFFFYALGLDQPEDAVTQPLYWDMVSFSTNFLGHFALAMGDEDLVKLTKALNSYIFSTHYSYPNDHPALGPDREEHTRLWKERIEAF